MTVSDLGGVRWRKSSRSGAGNDCVELAVDSSGAAVRDSKNPAGGHLVIDPSGWHAFLGVVKGERI